MENTYIGIMKNIRINRLNNFPNRLIINKSGLTDKNIITEKFNKVSVDVGATLIPKIPKSKDYFISCLTAGNTIPDEGPLIKD